MLKLKSISNFGVVLIEFGNPVKVPAEYLKARSLLGSAKKALAVLVKSNSEAEDGKSVNFEWDIAEFTEKQLKLQLTFEDANGVSVGVSPEILIVQVVEPSVFADSSGQLPVNFVTAQEIPRQI